MCLILQRTRTWLSLQTYVTVTVLVSSSYHDQCEKEVSYECNIPEQIPFIKECLNGQLAASLERKMKFTFRRENDNNDKRKSGIVMSNHSFYLICLLSC